MAFYDLNTYILKFENLDSECLQLRGFFKKQTASIWRSTIDHGGVSSEFCVEDFHWVAVSGSISFIRIVALLTPTPDHLAPSLWLLYPLSSPPYTIFLSFHPTFLNRLATFNVVFFETRTPRLSGVYICTAQPFFLTTGLVDDIALSILYTSAVHSTCSFSDNSLHILTVLSACEKRKATVFSFSDIIPIFPR